MLFVYVPVCNAWGISVFKNIVILALVLKIELKLMQCNNLYHWFITRKSHNNP